jgi:hypothetical protein
MPVTQANVHIFNVDLGQWFPSIPSRGSLIRLRIVEIKILSTNFYPSYLQWVLILNKYFTTWPYRRTDCTVGSWKSKSENSFTRRKNVIYNVAWIRADPTYEMYIKNVSFILNGERVEWEHSYLCLMFINSPSHLH